MKDKLCPFCKLQLINFNISGEYYSACHTKLYDRHHYLINYNCELISTKDFFIQHIFHKNESVIYNILKYEDYSFINKSYAHTNGYLFTKSGFFTLYNSEILNNKIHLMLSFS